MTSYDVELVIPENCDVEGADETATVEEGDETATIEVDADQYVLAAARASGIWLPADCQQGWCTTCAAELLSGEVDQSDAKRYYDSDRQADLILSCVAKPESDLRLRVCQQDAMLDHRAANSLPPGNARR